MATIVKAISANGIKNGAAQIRVSAGRYHNVDTDTFSSLTDNTAILDEPALADIQDMADDFFDLPRYYAGDTDA
jgi:hypothetical protein